MEPPRHTDLSWDDIVARIDRSPLVRAATFRLLAADSELTQARLRQGPVIGLDVASDVPLPSVAQAGVATGGPAALATATASMSWQLPHGIQLTGSLAARGVVTDSGTALTGSPSCTERIADSCSLESLSAGVSFPLPPSARPQRPAVERARLDIRQARIDVVRAREQALFDVLHAFSRVLESETSARSLDREVMMRAEAHELAKRRHQIGLIAEYEVWEARRLLHSAQLERLRAIEEARQARIEISCLLALKNVPEAVRFRRPDLTETLCPEGMAAVGRTVADQQHLLDLTRAEAELTEALERFKPEASVELRGASLQTVALAVSLPELPMGRTAVVRAAENRIRALNLEREIRVDQDRHRRDAELSEIRTLTREVLLLQNELQFLSSRRNAVAALARQRGFDVDDRIELDLEFTALEREIDLLKIRRWVVVQERRVPSIAMGDDPESDD